MSDNDGGGYSLWTVIKAVLITLGFVYLISVVTWAAQWLTIALAIGGVGLVAYKLTRTFAPAKEKEQKLLTSEPTFDQRMRQLEHEERALDRKLGL